MSENGFFLITDITGYTSFLNKSELDHAQHIIEALFDAQLKTIREPLKVSNFQGDAILCYAPENRVKSGNEIIEQVKRIYNAFESEMKKMQIDPPCSCKACATIDILDLKIFLHYGEYLVKKIGDREELIGSEVILAHRMMKNEVAEQTGIKSYLLMSSVAGKKLGSAISDIDFTQYSETYDHIGKIDMLATSLPSMSG